MYTKYKSTAVSLFAVIALMVLLAGACIALPFLVRLYINDAGLGDAPSQSLGIMLYVCLYSSVVPAFVASYYLYKMLVNIKKNIVFDRANVACLRYISWCCFIVALIYFVLGFAILFSFVVAAATGFIGLVVRVIKNLLNEAVDIKLENDLTV